MARVTLKMIAEKAGTSIGTVDRALNNRKGVNHNSKLAVLKVADELGYKPNKLASALGRKKAIRIGIVYPRLPHEFYHDIDLGVDKAIEELQDFGVIIEKIRYESQDPTIALQCLNQIDPSKYDGLAITSAGADNVAQIDNFISQGLAVITFITDAVDSNRIFYIGNNSSQSGMIGGEILGLMLQGQGNVAVFGNFARTAPFIERFGGFCEFVQPNFPMLNIIPCPENHDYSQFESNSFTKTLKQHPEIDGIFCTGYSSTIVAINAAKALNRKDIKIVGYDITQSTSQALREGWCNALLYQAPSHQAQQAAHLLVKHILEGWVPPKPRLHIDTQIVIKSNLDNFNKFSSQFQEIGK